METNTGGGGVTLAESHVVQTVGIVWALAGWWGREKSGSIFGSGEGERQSRQEAPPPLRGWRLVPKPLKPR